MTDEFTFTIKLDPAEQSATVTLCEPFVEWLDGVDLAKRDRWEKMLRVRLDEMVESRADRGQKLTLEEARELASIEVAEWLREIHAEYGYCP